MNTFYILKICVLLSSSMFVSSQTTLPVTINVNISQNSDFGEYLTDGNSISLYMFELDSKNVSNCSGNCLVEWPPYLIDKNSKPLAGTGVNQSMLSTITRPDSTVQVTYNGWPLYYYKSEVNTPNVVNCQGISNSGGLWFILRANGNVNFTTKNRPANLTSKNTLEVATSQTFGQYVTDKNNVVLYVFEKDSFLKSNCYGDCAVAWPPYTVGLNEIPTFGSAIDGSLVFYTVRTDQTRQVTYNGWPLYYYQGETTAGTTKCQNVNMNGGFWWLAKPNGDINKSPKPSTSSSSFLTYGMSTFALISLLF